MRKLYLFITFLMIFTTLQAQNISVLPGDFYRDSKDLTARTQAVKNDNNKNCALLKVITTEKGFTFEPDALGICKEVEYKTSEIWVWLAPGSRRITIKHPQLGQLRDYVYPEAIEASTVYVMKLTTAKVTTVVEEVNTSNYVALTVNPAEASVKIDGQLVAVEDGQFQGRFPMGKHDYEVSCDMYHAENGTFTIVPDKTTYLQVNLKPNYGYLQVNSSPEEGALVYVNNRKVGETPYTSDKMLSGTYTVQVVKAMYKEANRQVVIEDGKKLEVQLNMPPNFAEPVITCADADAEIWVNDEYLGKGSWTGRLSAGPYNVEVKKDRCRTVSRQVELKTGDKPTIDFPAPEPICGKLDVTTKPFGAEIFLDGKKIGMTPQLFDKVQIGKHSLGFRKTGCASVIREITIAEGQTLEVNETLKTGREVKLNTTPAGCEVYVDGNLVGVSPVTTTLSFGTHSVRVEKDGVNKELQITVTESSGSSWSLSLAKDGQPCEGARTLRDYDGNVYNTVQIGQQCWMRENLRTTHYANGTSISLGSSTSTITPYRYYPNNDKSNVASYGYLYNWKAVMRNSSSSSKNPSGVQGICPTGWHVPSDAEWTQLTNYVSSQSQYVCGSNSDYIAKALASTTGWNSYTSTCAVGNDPSTNNATGFAGVPAGNYYGSYDNFGEYADFWSSTEYNSSYAYKRSLYYDGAIVCSGDYDKGLGFSLRCLRD